MSETPLLLDDDAFTEDAPPGYRSQRDKKRYVPLMAALLGGTFVLQFTLPMIFALVAMPVMMSQQFSQGLPQYTKMGAWQDALWYPIVAGGGGRGECKLSAMDYHGKPLDRTPIELVMQPEWLIAEGERLWAVSKDAVAEIMEGDPRPIVMRPSRYLLNPSKPFLYEGILAVVDRDDDDSPWTLFLFERGEWKPKHELVTSYQAPAARPVVSAKKSSVSAARTDDGPADALSPENTDSDQSLPTSGAAKKASSHFEVTHSQGIYHVVCTHEGTGFHHVGLPLKGAEGIDVSPESWTLVPMNVPTGGLTTVADAPAIVCPASDQKTLALWRYTGNNWNQTFEFKMSEGGPRTEFSTLTTPDGGRAFAVIETMAGLSNLFVELQPDGIAKVANLQGIMSFVNPFSSDYWKMQMLVNVPSQILMITMILSVTWLMKRYRDPNYYKGRVAVEYASLLRRIIAVFIDMLIVWTPVYLAWYFRLQSQETSWMQTIQDFMASPKTVMLDWMPILLETVGWLFAWGIIDWLMISFWGCSIGKLICGVRVARTNLSPPGLLYGLIRGLMNWIELPLFNGLIAYTLVAFLQNRQRLADLVAGTVVLKAGSLREGRLALAAATANRDARMDD